MKITVGRIVLYTLTEADADQINRRRTNGASIAMRIREAIWPLGAQAHIGNHSFAGQVFPMTVVRAVADKCLGEVSVNGQVHLDGTDVLWVTSVDEGNKGQAGKWYWPPRE